MQYGIYKHEAGTFIDLIIEAVSWGVSADGFLIVSDGSGFVVGGFNLAGEPITITSNHLHYEVRPGSTDEITLKPPRAEHEVSSTYSRNWEKFFGLYTSYNFKMVGLSDYSILVNGYKWDSVKEDYVFTSELFFEGDE